MSEKEKQELLRQINNLTPIEFSKLCLNVVKKIVSRKSMLVEDTIDNQVPKTDKDTLVNLMIEYNIKINDKKERK